MAYDFNSLMKQADEASNRDKFYTDFEDVDPNVLHQITELTKWMRTKGKGSDVREIIAQLFERTWLESIKEGNANMEVAQARGSYPNLKSRLDNVDNKQQKTTEQLAQKANKDEVTNVITPKGTLAYASLPTSGNQVGYYYYCPDGDGVHGAGNYVWNGTSWFFGGTGDEGYNLLKKDLGNYEKEIVLEKNIVETIISGKYALFTGSVGSNVLVQNNDSYCYMKINVRPNKYYSLSKNFGSDSFCGIADKDDKIIGKLNLYRDTEKTGYVFLTPPNAKYMYISLTPVTNDYVVIETDSDIRDYNSTEYPFDTVKKVIINKLSNETIINLSKDMYGIIPNHNVGFVTKVGNINQGASGNHYAIISGVSKGDIIVFSGQYSWGVLWGYYADGTPIELLGAGSYDKKRVIISDENIVKVIGWSADSQKELYIELIGLKNKCDVLQTEITNKTGNEIRVGLGKEFTTIQSAIEYAKLAYDVNTIPVTILVDNGVYEVSPKSEYPYYAIDKGANKISIKGESRDGTIIKCLCTSELQGVVLNIGGDCTIENLTIENLADNSYTGETVLDGNHRPYCIHNDTPFDTSENYYTTVKNCKLYSQCDTPIGAGLHDKQTQRYENVECIYDSNVNKQHGSMYIHAPYDANFMPNGLEIVDCVLVSLNEMPALCLWNVSSVGTLISNTKQTFIRNITATNGNNELSISGYNKTIYSKCNSNSALNI